MEATADLGWIDDRQEDKDVGRFALLCFALLCLAMNAS